MRLLFLGLLVVSSAVFGQTNPEIFLMEVSNDLGEFKISNFRNITNNEGYDSQPSFSNNNTLLFAGTENGQTEIMSYHLNSNTKLRINKPTSGGEYSPQKFPKNNEIAAVRLDTTGLQRLYAYENSITEQGTSRMLLNNLEVAYYAFHDNNRIIASVLGGNQLNLVIANLKTGEVTPYLENSGRSIHNVPNSTSVSYTAVNEDGNNDVFIVDIDDDKESYFVCQLPIGIEDHCWLNESILLLGSGSKLYKYDFYGKQEWVEFADLSMYNLSEISRITVSPNGENIALVAKIKS